MDSINWLATIQTINFIVSASKQCVCVEYLLAGQKFCLSCQLVQLLILKGIPKQLEL